MRILTVNDDGIDAVGLRVLTETLAARHDVVTVAPESERSAFSHSISIHSDIRVTALDGSNRAYSISGTPADCVKLGVLHLFRDNPPELVVSGINNGSNLGSDVMYSGTVSAALEAAYLGIRGIAVSLSDWNRPEEYYVRAARLVADRLDTLLALGLPVSTILNINYPCAAPFKGLAAARIGLNVYDDVYVEGGEYVRIQGHPVPHDGNEPDCDVELIKAGYATVSPISIDRNDYKSLARMKRRPL